MMIDELPVTKHREEILKLYEKHRVLLVIGETGSGKTTQIPKFIYEHYQQRRGSPLQTIAITQPRRVAAMALAKRVAEEMHGNVGDLVGYCVRFEEASSPKTRIKFLTDGMLLREVISDPELKNYSTIILDEAHERTLRTDILFGIVKRLLNQRSDLRLVIMSATLNAEKFLDFFENIAYLYRVPGRQFPVRLFYTIEPQQDYLDALVLSIFQIHVESSPGDILAFLTGQEEIEAVRRILEEYSSACPSSAPKMSILPIYASLPAAQQMAVFVPTLPGNRKIILATNIAETSLTIPGIRYVIDTGMVKMRLFSPRSGMETLTVHPISKSAARQRCGRAGREQPGECYRLFTEDAFRQLEEETPPEILRTSLSNVILLMKASGIDDVIDFEYLDAPSLDALKRGLTELLYLKALDVTTGQLTMDGRLMAQCPLIPILARVLLESIKLKCSDDVITILAMLSAENIFHVPVNEREAATMAKRAFLHKSGDHLSLLAVYRAYLVAKGDARWCRDNFLDIRGLRMATDIRNQLVQFCERHNLPVISAIDPDNILKAFAAGFFLQCAYRQKDNTFRTMMGRQTVYIHPSSILHGQRPDCIIYHELTLTTKCYIRTVSIVQPSWVANYSKVLNALKPSSPAVPGK